MHPLSSRSRRHMHLKRELKGLQAFQMRRRHVDYMHLKRELKAPKSKNLPQHLKPHASKKRIERRTSLTELDCGHSLLMHLKRELKVNNTGDCMGHRSSPTCI